MSKSKLQSPSRLSWRAWLAWFLIEFIITAFFALWLILVVLRQPRAIHSCRGDDFWRAQLIGHAFELNGTQTQRVLWAHGRHGGSFLTTTRDEATASFVQAVHSYVTEQISHGYSWSIATAQDLHCLTGKDLGSDAVAWERWWTTEQEHFEPPPDAVTRLVLSRVSQSRGYLLMVMPRENFAESTVIAESQYQEELWLTRWRGTITTIPIIGLIVSLIGFPLLRRHWTKRATARSVTTEADT